jgi:transcriptional regulator
VYVPAHFAEERIDVLHAAIERIALGTLVTSGATGLEATHLPFLLDRDRGPRGTLIGHVARANRQWKRAAGEAALVTFLGPDSYVSPSAYPSKVASGGTVVPTWNYVAVHVTGSVHVVDEPGRLREIVTALTERHEAIHAEARGLEPWRVTDAPDDFVAARLRAVVGIEIPIDTIEGKWKLSQNRDEADQRGVVADLAGTGAAGTAVADAMSERLPPPRGTIAR